ncbi:MAG TPA: ABC transporter permease [Caldisericia bacterium]|jgi:peptide/nickel transport system permease protein|nr:ABC transporter permease [bacterium]NMD14572.1 ABC transporter permease [Caldisericales bacterium]HNW32129.1 ABC transporter permease [Caldisericia bacterium]HNY61789.1 ABC transporter permease [Caldisericia bacterium]HOC79383.1 ABC transporter permease [Caldisericia bacterium]
MGNYLFRRFVIFIFLFILVTVLCYFLLRLPGDPYKELELQQPNMKDEIARMREWSGFNDNWFVGYTKWAKKIIFDGDWGKSLYDKQPVWGKIITKIPVTLKIQVSVLILGLLLGIPLGIFSARRHYSLADYAITVFSYIGISVPNFWFGLLLMLLFSVNLGWLPAGWSLRPDYDSLSWIMKILDQARNLVLPVFMGLLGTIASLSRYMRSSMLEVIRQDYVRTARSKGLSETKVIYKHALRNGLIPIVTVMTLVIPSLISGSVVVERIFNINGMGQLLFNSVQSSDIPLAMGTLVMFAFLTLISLILGDVVYALVDPRITYS